MIYDNPRAMENVQRKVNRLSREMARRKKGGANWHKTVSKLNRAHAKVRNVRAYVLHNVSSQIIARKPRAIVIEDLNVKGMLANHHLARAISDVAFGELRRQLEYKAAWAGVGVVVADQWYPSSKTCSECGHVRDTLTLAEREYVCPACGMVLDRDVNAARNLAALAV